MVLGGALAVIASLAVAFAVQGRLSGQTHLGGQVEISAARAPALDACREMELVVSDVRANARKDRIDRELARATSESERAADLDPAWRPLAGGIASVAKGLNDNDGAAAGIGIQVVRADCPNFPPAQATSPEPVPYNQP